MNRPKHLCIALKLIPFVVAIGIFIIVHEVERFFFPVVSDFHVTSMRQYKDRIIMRGYMRKTRDCAFAGVSVYGETSTHEKTPLSLLYIDNIGDAHNSTRPTGTQSWGPWRVSIPVAPQVRTITLTAIHDCHFAWATKTHLATVPVMENRENEQ